MRKVQSSEKASYPLYATRKADRGKIHLALAINNGALQLGLVCRNVGNNWGNLPVE